MLVEFGEELISLCGLHDLREGEREKEIERINSYLKDRLVNLNLY